VQHDWDSKSDYISKIKNETNLLIGLGYLITSSRLKKIERKSEKKKEEENRVLVQVSSLIQ